MRLLIGHIRNVALVGFAVSLMAAAPASRSDECVPSPNGQCQCCGPGGDCCYVKCGTEWCDCCGQGDCSGNHCYEQ